MTYEEFDALWERAATSNPKAITLMANEVCSQHEHDVADLPTFEQLAPLYLVGGGEK